MNPPEARKEEARYGDDLPREERARELRCLYNIAVAAGDANVSSEDVALRAVELLQKAWQHPEIACVRLTLADRDHCTENFSETEWNMAAPIVADGETLGSLSVGYLEERPEADDGPFLAEERLLLDAAAELLSGTIARMELEVRAKELNRSYLQVLETASEGVLVVDVNTKRFKYANPSIHEMLAYEPGGLIGLGIADIHPEKNLGGVLAAFAAQARGETMLTENIPFLRKDGGVFFADVKTTPAIVDGTICNVGFVSDASPRAEATNQLRRRLKFEQIISTASTEFINLRAERLDDAMSRTLATSGRFFGFDSCHARVFKVDSDKVEHAYDWAEDGARHEAGPFGDIAWLSFGWARLRLLEFNPVIIPSVASLPVEATALRGALEQAHVRSAVVIPVMLDGNVVGTMSAAMFDTEREWPSESVSLFTTLGELMISARQREIGREGLFDVLDTQQRAVDSTVRVLSNLAELRDPCTAGHQRRVAEFSRAIALEMGLSADHAEGAYVAGMLHDIGKMHVPAEILLKSGPVDKLEHDVIKAHTSVGHSMLRDLDFPWPVADVALRHHERMDGSGYPEGLRGDDIPLEARIVAVADVVEAMTSYRPYRPALPMKAAVSEISYKRGVLYDDAVVDAALKLLTEKGFELREPDDGIVRDAVSGPGAVGL